MLGLVNVEFARSVGKIPLPLTFVELGFIGESALELLEDGRLVGILLHLMELDVLDIGMEELILFADSLVLMVLGEAAALTFVLVHDTHTFPLDGL